MRIDRILANSGYGTRREIRHLLKSGNVLINEHKVENPAFQIDEQNPPIIKVKEQTIRIRRYLHYMLNKPAGYVTALDDPKHPTVAGFFPTSLLTTGIAPIGRLDIDTTGLLIFTNDGVLNHRLTGPKWHVDKEYYFEITGAPLGQQEIHMFAEGITIDKDIVCKSADLSLLSPSSGYLTIREGKFHQVKKMMRAVNSEITTLHRTRMGTVNLPSDLSPGEFRELTDQEITQLYKSANLSQDHKEET